MQQLFNPNEFVKGDIILNFYYEQLYEVVEPEKNGMSLLKNINTGVVETWNANNNRHFIKEDSFQMKLF